MARIELENWMDKHKVTIESVFVPFSQSRNKDEKHKSLNWRITVRRDGRDILHTGYSAGIGHAPDYRSKTPPLFRGSYANSWRNDALEVNCELGFAAAGGFNGAEPDRKKPIKPDACDVLWSLSLDARVLDNSGFEDWAADLGYDTDSRKAEEIYKACLEIALKLRAGLGDAALAELQQAGEDF